jgi:molybdopterin-guanine dinucleotide biosynthesis protein A
MLSGIVLSGGQSTRMGEEKGLVQLGGRAMVEHVIAAIEPFTDELILVVGKGKTALYSSAGMRGVRIVEDRAELVGPLEGLVTAMANARGEYIVASPCDTPFLRGQLCELVADRARGGDGAVPIVRGYMEPLHAAYRRKTCLNVFERALKAGLRKPVDAYNELTIERVEEEELRRLDPDLDSYWNLNTQEELARARTRFDRASTI